ncbi:type III-A CRISPR-associated protein Csm2 [Methanocaldococcus fervens]|uniref:CRISPR system Cms protein Csm2 n=1 Tax=Methanocaldococcus fervens (strain DSM 4213 / JCM 15782 / AG86) TaxID=573064 RepID=C7P8A6_METFA|nr:type III-A CRISPR-associated protein Csm2 [Methanocaldococcus fervens]ACV24788.1 CRISPR-associated protein, Csm2 family [Methanocaldococcus fervens AG86]
MAKSKNVIIDKNTVTTILELDDSKIVDFLNLAENFAKNNLSGITFTKLRKFYDYVDRIDVNDKEWFIKFGLLKPKIAYHIGKEKRNRALMELEKLVNSVFNELGNEKDEDKKKTKFLNFKEFFEAVVAYRRAIEGK